MPGVASSDPPGVISATVAQLEDGGRYAGC